MMNFSDNLSKTSMSQGPDFKKFPVIFPVFREMRDRLLDNTLNPAMMVRTIEKESKEAAEIAAILGERDGGTQNKRG